MHLPPHPFWFWLIATTPFLAVPIAWVVANTLKVSLKPFAPWLWGGYVLLIVPYLLFDLDITGRHRILRLVTGACAWTCYCVAFWIKRHYMFETVRAPEAKWYFPWSAAEFSVPSDMRIVVRDIDSVAPWYAEKLGLRRLTENPLGETNVATFRFKEDGNSVVLTTHRDLRTGKTPIFYTKEIGKMREVIASRGATVGAIERDRQGTRYFQIRDPEGNEIEVVQEP